MNNKDVSQTPNKPIILRESEFFGGCIRVKISVKNLSNLAFLDVTLELENDESVLHFDRCEPEYSEKKGKLQLGNIHPNTDRTVAFYLDPLICAKEGTDINCLVRYKDSSGKPDSVQMKTLKIKVICPIFRTEQEINIGRLKELIAELRFRDSKVYMFPKKVELQELLRLCGDVIQLHDVRHIKTFKTTDENTYESWYYGKTKVTKKDLVIKCAIRKETESIEVFASGNDPSDITGLLAELGRNLTKEFEKLGKVQPVFNITIKDSVIQRSNLLSFCDLDGSCGGNVVIEGSVVQRSEICSGNEARFLEERERRKREEEAQAQREKEEEHHKLEKEEKSSGGGKWFFGVIIILAVLALGWYLTQDSRNNPQKTTPSVATTPITTGNMASSAAVTSSANQKFFTNSIGVEFVLIPSGDFDMGSPSNEIFRSTAEGPVHKVKIPNAFYMGKYEVMQKQWKDVMGSSPSLFKRNDLPVESVNWSDVQDFIKKLNEKEGTNKYRLPSEAEWEYAARAGTTTEYSFGEADYTIFDYESMLGDYAWYEANSEETHKGGEKKANPWGLYDMYGNVNEWVQDKWHSDYNGAPTDGSSWDIGNGSDRVFRGGSWAGLPMNCRSAFRDYGDPNYRIHILGFRLLREV